MKFVCGGLNKGEEVKQNMQKAGQQVKAAVQATARDVAEEIERRGRADIAGAGNFGGRWTSALRAEVNDQGPTVRIEVSMTGGPPVSFWKVFEYGATISAKNPSGMLWIPFDKGNTTWPRDYSGSLFRAGNALFDKDTKEPKYFGTPSVNIPKKFHLHEIVHEVAAQLKRYYTLNMSSAG